MRKRFAKIMNVFFLYFVHTPAICGCYLVLKIKYPDAVKRYDAMVNIVEPFLYKTDMRIMRILDKIEGQGRRWSDRYDANFILAGLNKGE